MFFPFLLEESETTELVDRLKIKKKYCRTCHHDMDTNMLIIEIIMTRTLNLNNII